VSVSRQEKGESIGSDNSKKRGDKCVASPETGKVVLPLLRAARRRGGGGDSGGDRGLERTKRKSGEE